MKDLATELDQEVERRARYAQRDFVVAQVVLWAAIIGSAAATVTVLKGWLSGTLLGGFIAALPAIVLLIDSRMHYEARHQWNARYKVELDILRRQLRDKRRGPAEVSESLDALDHKMENEFPYSGGAKAGGSGGGSGNDGGSDGGGGKGASKRRTGGAKNGGKPKALEPASSADEGNREAEAEVAEAEVANAEVKKG